MKMKLTGLSAIAVLFFSLNLSAQSPIGVWKSVDDNDGRAKSHIRIYEEGGKLFGKVIELLPAATITHCNKCSGEAKGKSLIDMIILRDLKESDKKWEGGQILDPAKGKEYSCQISLSDSDTLKVRCYIGSPLFGRTQYWYRVN